MAEASKTIAHGLFQSPLVPVIGECRRPLPHPRITVVIKIIRGGGLDVDVLAAVMLRLERKALTKIHALAKEQIPQERYEGPGSPEGRLDAP